LRARNAAQWKEVFMEDLTVVEGMQRGRFASGFDGGPVQPGDGRADALLPRLGGRPHGNAGGVGGVSQGALHAALLAAHAKNDRATLIGLYTDAADVAAEPGARAFYLTHAYVFALEAADPRAAGLKARLVAEGADLNDAT
jgi:hypothetical protein